MYESETQSMIRAAPDYITTLIATDYIHCKVEANGPGGATIAWTDFDEKGKRWVVHFHPRCATLSDEAKFALWRHEIGHIFFAHFNIKPCLPEDPHRSFTEMLQVGDLQINYYLLQNKKTMYEIGAMAKAIHKDKTGEDTEGPGFLDPEKILPELGLSVQEYPYEIIHSYIHQRNDEQEQNGEGSGEGSGYCGGIHSPGSSTAEATSAAVIAGVAAEGEKELGNSSMFGTNPGMGEIRLRDNDLPDWIAPLESFARAIVQTVLAEKRSHTRPQEIYKSVGVHMPTSRPRWAYKPAQVCFLVDTSGSMYHELRYVMPVISYLNQHEISVRLIAGDTYVTTDELIAPGQSLPEAIQGGGGTEITPLFDRAADYDPASLVCFTDGYVPRWPNDPGVPTLVVASQTEVPPWATKAN